MEIDIVLITKGESITCFAFVYKLEKVVNKKTKVTETEDYIELLELSANQAIIASNKKYKI